MSEALRNARTAVFVELLRAPSGAKELTDKGLSELSRSQIANQKKPFAAKDCAFIGRNRRGGTRNEPVNVAASTSARASSGRSAWRHIRPARRIYVRGHSLWDVRSVAHCQPLPVGSPRCDCWCFCHLYSAAIAHGLTHTAPLPRRRVPSADGSAGKARSGPPSNCCNDEAAKLSGLAPS